MWLSKYFVYFTIFSFMGWIYETIYCTIKKGKWDNRGFLYGPICPIYGMGGMLITAITDYLSCEDVNISYTWWQVFLIAFFGSVVLEYATSWILEKLFHAYWWDYSDIPFNINGRVCLPCSLGFGAAGILVVYVIAPFTKNLTKPISPLGYEILALVCMGLIAADTTLTVSALTHFERTIEAAEGALNFHMEQFVNTVVEKTQNATAAFEGRPSAAELLANGKQAISEKLAEEKERFSKENMERVISNMGFTGRSAIRRVEGFRKPRQKKVRNLRVDVTRLNSALGMIKEKVSRKK